MKHICRRLRETLVSQLKSFARHISFALLRATRTMDITTPYFVPDADIIMAIKTAVACGVQVRLLVPERVIPGGIVGPASQTYFGELLEAGVLIFMYNKGMFRSCKL